MVSSINNQHYLAVRPLSDLASDVEEYVDEVAAATGLGKLVVTQKLTGTALTIIKASENPEELKAMAADLKKAGLRAAVVSRTEIRSGLRPVQAKSVEIGQKRITFFTSNGEEALTLDGGKSVLIVIASPEFKALHERRIKKMSTGGTDPVTLGETLRLIYGAKPVVDIYLAGSSTPCRVDSARFNYNSLGDLGTSAAATNIPVIIKEVKRLAKSALLETGFGESTIPSIDTSQVRDRGDFMKKFSAYSRFIYLSTMRGVFAPPKTTGPLSKVPVISELGGMLWGGPLLVATIGGAGGGAGSGANKSGVSEDETEHIRVGASLGEVLPAAPEGLKVDGRSRFGKGVGVVFHLASARKYGPPTLTAPLMLIALAFFGLAAMIERIEPVSISIVSFGLILFIHSFMLIKRKHAIENCPTSNIGTMPMGEVEVYGAARRKYQLKTPYSLLDCVYYSYNHYVMVRTDKGVKRRLKAWGSSGSIPFYVEDDTGRVQVIPSGAIIKGGENHTTRHGDLSTAGSQIMEETFISVGRYLYVMGFAHRVLTEAGATKKKLMSKLRELKADKEKMMEFDFDGDGNIDAAEWDEARLAMEEEAMLERLDEKKKKDTVAIGEHPTGGLFYISDSHEEGILTGLAWSIPFAFITGIACVAGGAYFILQIVRNEAILNEILTLTGNIF